MLCVKSCLLCKMFPFKANEIEFEHYAFTVGGMEFLHNNFRQFGARGSSMSYFGW